MDRLLPVGKDAKGAAGLLLAALPAIGALLTALAVTGDIVGRMARNHPLATLGAFGCGAVAVFLGAVAAYGLREGSLGERRTLQLGLLARRRARAGGLRRCRDVGRPHRAEHHGHAAL